MGAGGAFSGLPLPPMLNTVPSGHRTDTDGSATPAAVAAFRPRMTGMVLKGPSTPRELPETPHRAARNRLKSGEPASRIAQAYGFDVDTIRRVGMG
jgi:hypothetical protein